MSTAAKKIKSHLNHIYKHFDNTEEDDVSVDPDEVRIAIEKILNLLPECDLTEDVGSGINVFELSFFYKIRRFLQYPELTTLTLQLLDAFLKKGATIPQDSWSDFPYMLNDILERQKEKLQNLQTSVAALEQATPVIENICKKNAAQFITRNPRVNRYLYSRGGPIERAWNPSGPGIQNYIRQENIEFTDDSDGSDFSY